MFSGDAVAIIANVVGGIALIAMISSSIFKNKNKILSVQILAHILLGISEALLNTFSSIVQEVISITRNISVIANKNTKIVNIVLILLGLIVGILINYFLDNNSWIGYLPILANLEYSIFVLKGNTSVNMLKLSFFVSGVLWSIFFIVSGNYISGILNLISASIALCTVIKSIFFDKKK